MKKPKPNAKMKINKNGVRFESNVDAVDYTMAELQSSCLHDIARVIKYRWQVLQGETIKAWKRMPRKRKKGTLQHWVRGVEEGSLEKELQLGLGNMKKGQEGSVWYSIPSELGLVSNFKVLKNPFRSKKDKEVFTEGETQKTQPQRGNLRRATMESLGEIQKITEQYFQKLNEEDPEVGTEEEDDFEND